MVRPIVAATPGHSAEIDSAVAANPDPDGYESLSMLGDLDPVVIHKLAGTYEAQAHTAVGYRQDLVATVIVRIRNEAARRWAKTALRPGVSVKAFAEPLLTGSSEYGRAPATLADADRYQFLPNRRGGNLRLFAPW